MAELPKEVKTIIDTIMNDSIETVSPSTKLKLGNLLCFVYNAKFKDSLQVWDKVPLVILLDIPDGKYILGVNLHYIPFTYRLNLLKALDLKGMRIKYSDIVRAWNAAKVPMAFANLAIRKYLISHIQSKVKIFTRFEDQYEVTKNILPHFQKMQAAQVYKNINAKVKAQRSKSTKG